MKKEMSNKELRECVMDLAQVNVLQSGINTTTTKLILNNLKLIRRNHIMILLNLICWFVVLVLVILK